MGKSDDMIILAFISSPVLYELLSNCVGVYVCKSVWYGCCRREKKYVTWWRNRVCDGGSDVCIFSKEIVHAHTNILYLCREGFRIRVSLSFFQRKEKMYYIIGFGFRTLLLIWLLFFTQFSLFIFTFSLLAHQTKLFSAYDLCDNIHTFKRENVYLMHVGSFRSLGLLSSGE